MKISTAIRRYEEQMQADGKSAITRRVYSRDLEHLVNALGKKATIESITPLKLTRFINSERFSFTSAGKPKEPTSLNRSKTAIRTFFQFLVDAGYIKKNPAHLVKLARTSKKPPRPMSDTDVTKFFSTINKDKDPLAKRDDVMFSLMLGTGMRIGALVKLTVSDLDLSSQTIRIKTKGGLEQVVYLNKHLCRQLRKHMKGTNGSALFQSRNDRPIQERQVQIRFAQWLNGCNIKNGYTVHSLRHTFATRLYQQTRDIRLVQAALGHSHVTTTEIYAECSIQSLRGAVTALNQRNSLL